MPIPAFEQATASVVLLETVAVVDLVSVENQPITSVAIATVKAISRTAAINGDMPFFFLIIDPLPIPFFPKERSRSYPKERVCLDLRSRILFLLFDYFIRISACW